MRCTDQKSRQLLGFTLLGLCLTTACRSRQESASNPPTTATTAIAICRTEPTDKAWYSSGQKAPLFDSLGNLHVPITTRNPEVQRYFDQGLMLSVGFNHRRSGNFNNSKNWRPTHPLPKRQSCKLPVVC